MSFVEVVEVSLIAILNLYLSFPAMISLLVTGWYQDENGDWFNEFDWHVDENGEYYYGDQRGYEGWYQDANGEWISPEEAQPQPASSAGTAKPANGSVVKSTDATAASVVKLSESSEESSASKSSSQVKLLVFICGL